MRGEAYVEVLITSVGIPPDGTSRPPDASASSLSGTVIAQATAIYGGFEGYGQTFIGVRDRERPLRVTVLANPTRLVVDVANGVRPDRGPRLADVEVAVPRLGAVVGDPAQRGIEAVGSRRRAAVDLQSHAVSTALGGIRDDGVQQRFCDTATARTPVHADVVDIAPLDPEASARSTDETRAPAGSDALLGLDRREPPVVPPVAGVLAQPHDELGEALAVGAEVVLERLLEDPVDGLEVLRDGQSVAVAGRRAARDAGPRPRQGRRLLGRHRPGHLQPGARVREAGGRQPGPAGGRRRRRRPSRRAWSGSPRMAVMSAARRSPAPKSAAARAAARRRPAAASR